MIPTRLYQTFQSGRVLGFNSLTGSVMCFHDNGFDYPTFDPNSIDFVIEKTMRAYPGYTWPSIDDLEVAVELLQFTHESEAAYVYLSSRSIANQDLHDTGEPSPFMIQLRFAFGTPYTRKRALFSKQTCNGLVLPVLYINGENCDTY